MPSTGDFLCFIGDLSPTFGELTPLFNSIQLLSIMTAVYHWFGKTNLKFMSFIQNKYINNVKTKSKILYTIQQSTAAVNYKYTQQLKTTKRLLHGNKYLHLLSILL